MKKKIFIFMLMAGIVLTISGCGTKPTTSNSISATYQELSFNMPDYFEKSEGIEGDMDFYDWDDVDGERKNSCSLSIVASTDYGNSKEETVKSDLGIYGGTTDEIKINTKTINGTEWTTGSYTTGNATYYKYIATHNGKEYTVSYDDVGSGNICGEAFDIISNSLNFN